MWLGVDTIDFYLLHWRGPIPPAGTLEAFAALAGAGKTRNWGVSVALSGSPDGQLGRIRWRHSASGNVTEKPLRHLFLSIGTEPATSWLHDCMALDAKGFVQTGEHSHTSGASTPSFQSSVVGVFAVGDVRSGLVKRVGAAIGEGGAVVAQLHAYLAASSTAGEARPQAHVR